MRFAKGQGQKSRSRLCVALKIYFLLLVIFSTLFLSYSLSISYTATQTFGTSHDVTLDVVETVGGPHSTQQYDCRPRFLVRRAEWYFLSYSLPISYTATQTFGTSHDVLLHVVRTVGAPHGTQQYDCRPSILAIILKPLNTDF